ncbi:uncharacterized protein [Porites lutea]|uniref:uncharacterized protein n=1 Tax=Porites lutea TaxID=51062 RepID=UPI003CC5ED0F
MVSFNVESFFTNVPIKGTVRATLWKLESDLSFPNHTTLTAAQIANLLNYVLTSTYFQYDGAIYEQQDGAAMGSPVFAVIANLYMEDFEEQSLSSVPTAPKIWKRNVDDTFTILEWTDIKDFLQHLNTQQPSVLQWRLRKIEKTCE